MAQADMKIGLMKPGMTTAGTSHLIVRIHKTGIIIAVGGELYSCDCRSNL